VPDRRTPRDQQQQRDSAGLDGATGNRQPADHVGPPAGDGVRAPAASAGNNNSGQSGQPAGQNAARYAGNGRPAATPVVAASAADHWARLVNQASRAGYVVQNRYHGRSEADPDRHILWIAFDQDPQTRIVDLAELVDQLDTAAPVPSAHPAASVNPSPTPTAATTSSHPAPAPSTVTPIFDDLAHRLGWSPPAEAHSQPRQHLHHAGGDDDAEADRLTAVFASLNAKLGSTAGRVSTVTAATTAHETARGPTLPNGLPDNLAAVFASLTMKLGSPPRNGTGGQPPQALPTDLPRTHLAPRVAAERRPPLVPSGVEADRATAAPALSTRAGDRVPAGRDRAGR
jgi:hypothetical protein